VLGISGVISLVVALLRCVGASRRQIFASVLLESLIVGAAGSILGIVVGVVAAVLPARRASRASVVTALADPGEPRSCGRVAARPAYPCLLHLLCTPIGHRRVGRRAHGLPRRTRAAYECAEQMQTAGTHPAGRDTPGAVLGAGTDQAALVGQHHDLDPFAQVELGQNPRASSPWPRPRPAGPRSPHRTILRRRGGRRRVPVRSTRPGPSQSGGAPPAERRTGSGGAASPAGARRADPATAS
jgi:FtsX-like permease family